MSGDNHNQPVRRMSDDEARMFVAPPAQETWTEVSGPNHNRADDTVPTLNPPTQVLPESSSDDAFFHELDDDCPCGPTSEPVKRDDGSVGWVIVHHSLDGRELGEVSS